CHHAPGNGRHRNAGTLHTREQLQRLFTLRTQLGGQVGECDVAVQELLDQRVELVLAHVWSLNCSRSLSYARCIRIFSDGTEVLKRSAISLYDNPSTCFRTNTSRWSGVNSNRARCSARRCSAVSAPPSARSTAATSFAASSDAD